MTDLEPNDDGTVCCICRKPIVPNVDIRHGLYLGTEARHYACSAGPRAKHAFEEFDEKWKKSQSLLDRLRSALEKD